MGPEMLKRSAMIALLVRNAGARRLGRTALMKCMYFLAVLKGVPLGYRFTLYTYGPFDSAVLEDLSFAESLGAIDSELVSFPGGERYELKLGEKANDLIDFAGEKVRNYEREVEWVVRQFGNYTALRLEMASTIIYVDRLANKKNEKLSFQELSSKVKDIKAHLDEKLITEEIDKLARDGLLTATA